MHGVKVDVVYGENEGLIFRRGRLVAAVTLEGKIIPSHTRRSILKPAE